MSKLQNTLPLMLLVAMTGCAPEQPTAATAPPHSAPNVVPAAAAVRPGKDAKNATYMIDGEPVTLIDGVEEKTIVPGSASKQVTRLTEHAFEMDLNDDGQKDQVFLLIQDSGGSGTFYYAAAALKTPQGYQGTNAVFIGDRITVQYFKADPEQSSQFWISYGDRQVGEPTADDPMNMASKEFRWDGASLVEVAAAAAK
ncbi:hypothetical protein [Lysobacter antibioticus]|uniref:hypothetical protein n=1 Tax=Lysobacter antibioticus TaxID=84531 RepID=UPI000AAD97C5|nr:hypothetical protein [Lysobacter antibioticus]